MFLRVQPARLKRTPEGSLPLILERSRWLQPLKMPRLHALNVHEPQFVSQQSMLGCLSEEVFEHFQQSRKTTRLVHCPNQSLGAQITSGIQILWMPCSVGMKEALAEAVNMAIDERRSVPLKYAVLMFSRPIKMEMQNINALTVAIHHFRMQSIELLFSFGK